MSDIYYGRGQKEQFDDYIDFINYVFGFNGNQNDFKKLLPKVYNRDYDPAYHSFNAIKDGKFLAVIGAFPGGVDVCGIHLKTCGIGGVAVHPYHRGQGYMKTCLNMAIDDMIRRGVDMSVLAGQRQRYNYFSYDKVGTNYIVYFTPTNLRHAFGESSTSVKMKEVGPEDKAYLNLIEDMSRRSHFVPTRERERLYSILCSWGARPYVFVSGEQVLGYCVKKGTHVTEIYAQRAEDVVDFVRAIVEETGSNIKISLPPFEQQYLSPLIPLCDDVQIWSNHMFTVLNYRRVITAFLRLKQTYDELPEGEMRLLIHGRAGDERLKIAVQNGKVSVEPTDKPADIELSHLEAMRFFFANVSERRFQEPLAMKWFPLPIFERSADNV